MRKTLLPLATLSAAVGAAVLLARGGSPSRESLVPLSRAAGDQLKGVDRASAVVFPLSADEERAAGERLARGVAAAAPA
ncbi:MAG: hypothetical protein SF051_01145, partial [Elusimicrobiota bacterium]|nr:hypothetical protein [Elusimicrobiota bacterium]